MTPGSYYSTAIAVRPDGTFVVAWAGYYYGDGDASSVLARRFDAAGAPLADDFLINTSTTGFQDVPDITSAADGSFVIVWQDAEQEAIVARRYDNSGVPVSGEFVVNTSPVLHPDVRAAGAPDGRFVAVWRDNNDIVGRRFDGAGAPIGGEFTVNSITAGYQGVRT
jgi:hypothetical protein